MIGQYFYNRITRDHSLHAFTGSGAYVTLRGLIKGQQYKYTKTDGGIATPDPGNMELCLQYNYTSLSDRKNGSFPSGHTILGWSSALLLSEINPDRADTLLARGIMYGDSRMIVGAHWQSDVNAGRLAASAAYARLHTSERFLEQMRLARLEFRCEKGLATPKEEKEYKKAMAKRAKAK